MSILLDLPHHLEVTLAQQAHSEGLSLQAYLVGILERGAASHSSGSRLTTEEQELVRAGQLAERQRERHEAVERILRLAENASLGPDLTVRELIDEGRRF